MMRPPCSPFLAEGISSFGAAMSAMSGFVTAITAKVTAATARSGPWTPLRSRRVRRASSVFAVMNFSCANARMSGDFK